VANNQDTNKEKSQTLQEILTTNPNEVNKEKELNDFEEDLVIKKEKEDKNENI
tara:strand:+ start:173 stop:331 length:159 start_codon:yes stop_codon:yes gene_type:complete